MDLGVSGRNVLVTGGSRGIGRATAEMFASEGARVAITYRHNRERAKAVADALRSQGADVCYAFLDLAEPDSIQAATQEVLRRWGGRIDVLVNNAVQWAGTSEQPISVFENVQLDQVARLIRANVEGTFAMSQAVVPAMRHARWGRIVNLSSVAATEGIPGFAWYGTAKAAIHGLTRTLAHELGPWGILVNTVIPGLTRTETLVAQFPDSLLEQHARRLPIRRLLEPREVAAMVAFIASAMNTGVTGELIRVSGGRPGFSR